MSVPANDSLHEVGERCHTKYDEMQYLHRALDHGVGAKGQHGHDVGHLLANNTHLFLCVFGCLHDSRSIPAPRFL